MPEKKAGKRFKTKLIRKGNGFGINLPFNHKDVFGKIRAPVKVTINKNTFRTTTFSMGGMYWFPVNRENREK